MSNGEKASAIFNEYNNTNKGEAFVTTGCTKSTLDAVVNYIDSVIGAHSGPGTLAVFFLGEKR